MDTARAATLAQVIDCYLEWQRSTNRRGTCRTVTSVLRRYLAYTGGGNLPAAEGLGIDLARSYLARRAQEPGRKGERVSPATLAVDVRTLRACAQWAVDEGHLVEHHLSRLRAPRAPERSEPQFLEAREVQVILDELAEPWASMVKVGVLTGLRKGELYRLRWDDVDTVRSRIRVTAEESKTYRERWIPIGPEVLDALPARNCSPMVWPGRGGGPRSTNGNRVNEVLRRAAHAAGIARAGSITLHWMRHTFASHLVIEGASIDAVQRLLGHSQRSTTEIYTHLQDRHLREAMERHPMLRGKTCSDEKKVSGEKMRKSEKMVDSRDVGANLASMTNMTTEKKNTVGARLDAETMAILDQLADEAGSFRSTVAAALLRQAIEDMNKMTKGRRLQAVIKALRADK